MQHVMKLSDFDYFLPDHLIAQFPLPQRTQSRLLHLQGRNGQYSDHEFIELPNFLKAGDLIVFNDTKVIKARLKGQKASGGKVEVLIERILSSSDALAHIRASHAPKPSSVLTLAESLKVHVLERQEDLFLLRFETTQTIFELLDKFGSLPLPPYIEHTPNTQDEERYQTVYARSLGAVAAPTAGLHFDNTILNALKNKGIKIAYITLHVGAGTFQPVREENIASHRMHSEWYEVPQTTINAISETQLAGGQVVAVGTTTLRALESAATHNLKLTPGLQETNIFITPGFRFQIVDKLITNFHLPKSTLLMLISAFGGYENIKSAYRHAVDKEYRFFSYGDSMLIERADS